MEKIYSRKRINLPKVYFNRFPSGKNNSKKQKMIEIILILIVAIFIMFTIIQGINPIIDRICLDESRKKATIISNQQATEVMRNCKYEDMVTIYRDDDGNIKMIKSNIAVINEITSDVAVRIQQAMQDDNQGTINLRLREFYWQ